MAELAAKLQKAIIEAMKAREQEKLTSLRSVMSAIKKKEIDDRRELTTADEEKVLQTLIKQVVEAMDQARGAGRDDLVQPAEREIALWKSYLPQALTEAELSTIVARIHGSLKVSLPAGPAGMGALMKAVMAEVGSRADGKLIQSEVRKALGLA